MVRAASFEIRLGAILLDTVIIRFPIFIVSYFITGNFEADLITTISEVLYYLFIPVIWSGYTVGKKLTRIRIAKVNGEKLGIGTMLMRTLLAGIIYIVTLGIGLIVSAVMVGLRSDKRSLHDLIAGTHVVYDHKY